MAMEAVFCHLKLKPCVLRYSWTPPLGKSEQVGSFSFRNVFAAHATNGLFPKSVPQHSIVWLTTTSVRCADRRVLQNGLETAACLMHDGQLLDCAVVAGATFHDHPRPEVRAIDQKRSADTTLVLCVQIRASSSAVFSRGTLPTRMAPAGSTSSSSCA